MYLQIKDNTWWHWLGNIGSGNNSVATSEASSPAALAPNTLERHGYLQPIINIYNVHTLVHPDEGVDDVEEVAGVVEQQPGGGEEVVQLPEHGAAHHHDQVVQHRHVDHPQPLDS